ncbi:hypothetical protein INT47_002568 [Mucor saturninus]|uniref:No apical meristem-associated C-terminal domain-containing protein n=1 Tax=Mucor saturninus TaxID=64648 RepID=A0A8H7QG13_9FUNG|nr:hypothetical protein INT47_002568 [Mucor saturninus]
MLPWLLRASFERASTDARSNPKKVAQARVQKLGSSFVRTGARTVQARNVRTLDQTGPDFWQNIADDFDINYVKRYKTHPKERCWSSHRVQLTAIAKSVSKFSGFYQTSMNGPSPSGSGPEDMIHRAMEMYRANPNEKKGFQFLHLYKILESCEKWKNRLQIAEIKAKGKGKKAALILSAEDTSDEVRPMGRTKAMLEEQNDKEDVKQLASSYNAYIEITKEKMAFAKEKRYVENKQRIIMDRIMAEEEAEEEEEEARKRSLAKNVEDDNDSLYDPDQPSLITDDDDQQSLGKEESLLVEDKEPVLVEDGEPILVQDK